MIRSHPPIAAWTFDRAALVARGRALHASYRDARPYPHVVIDGLLGEPHASSVARAFPPPTHPRWKRKDHVEQRARLGQLARTGFEDVAIELRWLLAELTGLAFVDFLAALTGRKDLITDPHFLGAGPTATLPGGHLALHADFNRDSARHLDRVLTAIYYLPATWDAAWGGELELWDRARTRCEVSIAPVRDRLVVMAHGDDHWHGHPAPLRCPDGHVRAAVAAYYYAARPTPGDDDHAHGAIWG
jgi:hypothetical protein